MSKEVIRLASQGSLEEQLAVLKLKLTVLLAERDELLLHVCRNNEMEFMLKIGYLEYEAFKAQCEYLWAKRKCEMIQRSKNRQEKTDVETIDKLLEEELKDYFARLSKQFEELTKAIERNQLTPLAEEETQEIKTLYRQIIKRLHPDLNPNISEEELRLFHTAVKAYEMADLETIRMVYELVVDRADDDILDSLVLLKRRIKQIKEQLLQLETQIENIKAQYPYIYKDLLKDEDWVSDRQEMLRKAKADFIKGKETYEKRIEELLG